MDNSFLRQFVVACVIVAAGIVGWQYCRWTELSRHVDSLPANLQPTHLLPDVQQTQPSKVQQLSPSRASEIMRFGYPGFENLRTFEDFVLSYDRRNRTAHWVVEHLTPSTIQNQQSVDRSKCDFHNDDSIHPFFRSTNDDYKNSGYDRGHLAAAGNHRNSQNSIQQTFVLSNISPQIGRGFNRDKWNELEKHVRKLSRKHKNAYVCTGPLYLPRMENDGNLYIKYKVIGRNNVAVPTHFFKVVLLEVSEGKFDMEAYILPNTVIPDNTELSTFLMPLETIERASGLLIFEKLSKSSLRRVNGKATGIFSFS